MYELVRPFQTRQPQSTRRIVASSVKIDVEPAIISWGNAGSIAGAQQIEEIDESGTAFTVLTCDDKYEELDRREQNITIASEQDPNTFIVEARPTYIAFGKKSEFEAANYEKTTSFKTAIETATFSTVDFNNKKCRASYELKIEIPH